MQLTYKLIVKKRVKCQKDNTFNKCWFAAGMVNLKQFAKNGLMKNISENTDGFSNRDIRGVVLLLLKAELMLMGKMKAKEEHPDAAFTIQLKQSNVHIRTLLNTIMEDELAFLHAEKNGMGKPTPFLERIARIAGDAQRLLLFIESFQFIPFWSHECLEKIKALSSLYGEDRF